MLIEFADIWMIRKMLLNLRARALGLARTESSGTLHQPTEPAVSRTSST